MILTLKVIILGLTSIYIYLKLREYTSPEILTFFKQLIPSNGISASIILSFLGLAMVNWFFDILKWKTAIALVKNISIGTAFKQSLYALTVSMATPNRIGDYGAKAFFFAPDQRRKVLFLNFFSNSIQMLVTLLFGLYGLFYMIQRFDLLFSISKLSLGLCLLLIMIFLGYRYKEQQLIINGLTIKKVISKILSLPLTLKLKMIIYSVLKYMTFSFLFYRIMIFYGGQIDFLDAMPLIYAMYLLVSIVPTFFLFDVIVRGGAAVWLFSFMGVHEVVVIGTVLTMWILNFVIPSIIGGYFMFSYTPENR
jgi:hypothetical protein